MRFIVGPRVPIRESKVITGIIDPSHDGLAGLPGEASVHDTSLSQESRRRTLAMPEQNQTGLLSPLMTDFLAELAHANRSRHTCRAYATDLAQFSAFYRGSVSDITAEVLRGFGATLGSLRPASRARRQAALASFLDWAHCQGLVASDPMALIERVHRDPPRPRALGRESVEAVLAMIPTARRRIGSCSA